MLKPAKEKLLIVYKRSSIRLIADFSSETLEAKRHCNHIFKELKEKKNVSTKNSVFGRTALQKWRN